MSLPLPNSYWVIPGSLLAGDHPSEGTPPEIRARLQCLVDAGIDSILDLTQPGELPDYSPLLPPGLSARRMPIRDAAVPLDAAEMRAIQEHIAESLAAGRRLYVHCRAGIGRTGTVVGCYLAETGLDGPASLAELNRLWRQSGRSASWPEVPQTLEQADFIRHWPRYRRGPLESAQASSRRDRHERFAGCLLGLALGDALSARSQYRPAGSFLTITEPCGGGIFGLPPGHWSDDTALSLCVAEGLLTCGAWVDADQATRFGRWQHEGYLAAGTHCVAITPGTARWLHRKVPGSPRPALAPDSLIPEAAPLSRVAPLVMFHFADAARAVGAAAEATAALEPGAEVVEAARVLAAQLHAALAGEPLAAVLTPGASVFGDRSLPRALATWLESDPAREPQRAAHPALDALSTARWVLATSATFAAGALRIANMGADSDVIGAIHGQLAGAFYGQAALPGAWLRSLARAERIEALAAELFAAAHPRALKASQAGGQAAP